MNQNDCSGKTLKLWPVFVDHYTNKSGEPVGTSSELLYFVPLAGKKRDLSQNKVR
ncbi:hypothetical protein ITX54_24100 [Rouxiella silvae]|uniref:Uncharacterized protein n=1 Tax=Rouxiella silvae TaxID=1646373 RepID=A0AA41BZ32_9GAMM|nr:hypothetical protein [Rouxiella silvae]MBF6639751.1 hypothetical protein [Rouxiella silvae]